MLFNSFAYIFVYLPITFITFYSLAKRNHEYAILFLVIASLFFYGWWNYQYLLLLSLSILFNYTLGMKILTSIASEKQSNEKLYLIIGVSINLILLVYFKYTNFIISELNLYFGTSYNNQNITLPLGISFFTFTQIAFLIDTYHKKAKEYNIVHYSLFVTYFPHLIAGPVLHHKEMMPQFSDKKIFQINYYNVATGLTLFFFGLFKKVVLADNLTCYVTPVFDAASSGENINTFEAWGASLSYTLQIYFDFSGYTDMAIGASKMFGVDLPINFNSPYKSKNIIEFWRRWHMTLSRFLRDYLYIPLGGNRRGVFRMHVNLLITMLLGGLWHGANWTYVLWGGLHGFYLILNHVFQKMASTYGLKQLKPFFLNAAISRIITFLAVVFAWVFFRASSIDSGINIVKGMLGMNGTLIPLKWAEESNFDFLVRWMLEHGCKFSSNDILFTGNNEIWIISIMLGICWFMPNTTEIVLLSQNEKNQFWSWKLNAVWLLFLILISFISILFISDLSEFIYFQF